MVLKASRNPGPRSDAVSPATTSSPSTSPRTNAVSASAAAAAVVGSRGGGNPRRGSRVSELQNATRRTSLLYQVYDSASVTGANAAGAPSPSHAAVVAAAAVIANPSGRVTPSSTSSVGNGRTANGPHMMRGRGGGRRSSLASGTAAAATRSRKTSNGPAPSTNVRGEGRSDVHPDPPSASNDQGGTTAATAAPSSSSSRGLTCVPHNHGNHSQHGTSSDDTMLPRPFAKGGSYANENPRLIVSDPLPTTSTGGTAIIPTSTSPVTATLRSHSNASERPRALSLPRTRKSVAEVLPRLRPVRSSKSNTNLPGNTYHISDSLDADLSAASHPRAGPGESLRPSPPPAAAFNGNSGDGGAADGDELREVLSAPPGTLNDLKRSSSPRLRTRRVCDGGSENPVATSCGVGGLNHNDDDRDDDRQREFPAELEAVSEGGTGRDRSMAAPRHLGNGAFMHSIEVKSLPTPLRAAKEKEATKKRWSESEAVTDMVDDDDENWGDPETSSQEDATGHMFSSTQLLSSLRQSNAKGNETRTSSNDGSPSTSAAQQQALHQSAVPSITRPHPTPPPTPDASVSPAYKFNVVLSSGKTATVPISLIAGSGCVQGMRPTMEDAHFIELNAAHVHGQPVSLMAVLDGHCGRRVADLGAKWLPHYVLSHAALGENNALALVESILQTDREIFHTLQAKKRELEQQRKEGRSTGRRRRDVCEEMMDETTGANGGSTLIVAAVCGRMLYVACLGDARAVLYDGHTTIAMSEDHKPGNSDESRRIAKCGGFVQFGRVCGILAVSRALGDFEFKFHPTPNSEEEEDLVTGIPPSPRREGDGGGHNSSDESAAMPQSPVSSAMNNNNNNSASSRPSSQANCRFISNRDLMVSNVADVRQLNLTDASAFLLLACDGLWDVLSNEEATEFVRDFLSYTPDVCDPRILSGEKPRPSPEVVRRVLNNCCQKLTEFAVDRGSMDNVSAMVLFFHDVVDTVARFNGRLPASHANRSSGNSSSMSDAGSRNSRTRQGRGPVQPPPPPSSFDLTNNQPKVRNGRVVTRR